MYDLFKSYDAPEDDDTISATVQTLWEKGVKVQSQLVHCPPEVLSQYLSPATHGRQLILAHCIIAKLKEENKKNDPMSQAFKLMAKE